MFMINYFIHKKLSTFQKNMTNNVNITFDMRQNPDITDLPLNNTVSRSARNHDD